MKYSNRAVSRWLVPLVPGMMILLFFMGVSARGQENDNAVYETGMLQLLAGERTRAIATFEQALTEGGPGADLSRLQLIRLYAEAGEPVDVVLPYIQALEDEDYLPAAWLAAIRAYRSGGNTERAMEIAMTWRRMSPQINHADLIHFEIAWMRYQQGQHTAAMEQLFQIIEGYPEGEALDDAYYLLARIYLTPGDYYNPSRAEMVVKKFLEKGSDPRFKGSIWKSELSSLQSRMSLHRGNVFRGTND